MDSQHSTSKSYPPKLHNDVYPYIYPSKFRDSLKGKVTIITGSAGTIGSALAECFAVAGARLVLVYNRTEPPPALKERCTAFGATSITCIKCNVSELNACEQLVRQVVDTHGIVDILINNAGANGLGPDPKDFIYDIAVNFYGPYYLMRLLIPHFRDQHSGCVLNIASRAGTVEMPYSTSYCSSKAALINLTQCAQKELDIEEFRDIHLYSLHPGGVKSEMTLNKYSTKAVEKLPAAASSKFANWLDMYIDSPYLNGMTCVALASGVAKDVLRGKYFDVTQDLEDVVKQAEAIKSDSELYTLHTTFVGGLPNDGGPPNRPRDTPFDFPGF